MKAPPLSTCPHCGARGVKEFQPLTKDGYQCDVPYCGICGKNWPDNPEPIRIVRPTEREW